MCRDIVFFLGVNRKGLENLELRNFLAVVIDELNEVPSLIPRSNKSGWVLEARR